MIVARAICADRRADLNLAFDRMAFPLKARDYLLEKLPQLQVLLTGLGPSEGRFLQEKARAQEAPGREVFPFFVAGDQRHRPGTALLTGRREQLEHLREEARATPELAELARALGELLDAPDVPLPIQLAGRTFEFGRRTYLMGVVNVTPDSFSDGGRFLAPERAVEHGLSLARAGADLLDVGGESTRPGARRVGAEEELQRILPVVRALAEQSGVPVSVDTTRAEVAREALAAGAVLVNDISGFGQDPTMARVTAEAGAACCLMHIQGTPETMQQDPRYEDVVGEVLGSLRAAVERATSAGVPRDRILVDPGIGFGKTAGHNLLLLRRLADLRVLGLPILVGTSRKAFLGKLAGGKPASERLFATLGSVAAMAALGGADVVRVHDVAEAKDALAVADAIREASEAGSLFERPRSQEVRD